MFNLILHTVARETTEEFCVLKFDEFHPQTTVVLITVRHCTDIVHVYRNVFNRHEGAKRVSSEIEATSFRARGRIAGSKGSKIGHGRPCNTILWSAHRKWKELKIFGRKSRRRERDGESRRLRRRRRRCRVNVVVLGALCVRILFADGYEIDILGDPTRVAHGTNKRRGGEPRANIRERVLLRGAGCRM